MKKIRKQQEFDVLLQSVRACTLCSGLPLSPHPILQASYRSRILIAGQAPGRNTHARGRPFDDASGDRCGTNLTDTVSNWQQFWPAQLPLPHPSPRNARWLKNNPQVEAEMLPLLRQRVRNILGLHCSPASPIIA